MADQSDDKKPEDDRQPGEKAEPQQAGKELEKKSPEEAAKQPADEKRSPDAKPAPKKKPSTGGAPPKRRGGALIAWLALLVAAGSAGLSGYLYQQWQRQLSAEGAGIQSLQSGVDSLQKQQAQLRAQLETLSEFRDELRSEVDRLSSEQDRARQQLQDRLDEQGQRLIALRQELQSLGNTDRSDWLLAEAEYLLRLANQRLIMGRDIKGAIQMLASADQIMVELDDSALHPVRAAIADEIAALRTAAQFDLEGLYLRLRAAASQTAELKLYEKRTFEAEESTQSATGSGPAWLEPFRDAWRKLSRYIRIDKREQTFKPLLTPEQEAILRYSLRLKFEQAQMALLAGNEQLYHRSLARARDSIRQYFLLDDKATKVVALIDELVDEPVSADVPDVSRSLRLLKQYIDSMRGSASNGGGQP